jgi:hypothetical protein
MRSVFVWVAILATTTVISGCTIFQPPEPISAELTAARQTVKIYDTTPPNSSPVEQIDATACNGTRELATDKLLTKASELGANGVSQLSCRTGGFSFSCMSSETCIGTAIKVVEPSPPPQLKRAKTKPKPKKKI